ncbi:hypothetical protein ACKWTF_010973 [Chironomus riparius]
MMETDLTLDKLPETILEEIFALIPKKLNLRLVCKTFKNIIDNSARLLKDEWLSVENTLTLNSSNIHYPYQKLVLHSMGAMELYWISKYQHKDLIKKIRITSGERCPTMLQYIISNFNSLEVLDFDLDRFYDEHFFMNSNMKLEQNERSKLNTLRIGYFQDNQYNILEMFANITSIKNVYIHDFNELRFPENVQWKLEKLIIPDRDEPDWTNEINDENCKQFLLNQTTLKELRCFDSYDYAMLIMKNLLNLERLTLNIKKISAVNNEFLISNKKLQHLGLNFMCQLKLKALKTFLSHYNNIKELCLTSSYCYEYTGRIPMLDMEFENLTHLFLKSPICLYILKAKLPKLKVLGLFILNEKLNFGELTVEHMKNVEKLSISEFGAKYVTSIVQKCPKLTHLNVEFRDWYGQIKTFIGDILEVAPQIEFVGIVRNHLRDQEEPEKFLEDASDFGIMLKVYDDITSIMAEDWGREVADYLNLW